MADFTREKMWARCLRWAVRTLKEQLTIMSVPVSTCLTLPRVYPVTVTEQKQLPNKWSWARVDSGYERAECFLLAQSLPKGKQDAPAAHRKLSGYGLPALVGVNPLIFFGGILSRNTATTANESVDAISDEGVPSWMTTDNYTKRQDSPSRCPRVFTSGCRERERKVRADLFVSSGNAVGWRLGNRREDKRRAGRSG